MYPQLQVNIQHVEKLQGESYLGVRIDRGDGLASPVIDLEGAFHEMKVVRPYEKVLADLTDTARSILNTMPEISAENLRHYDQAKNSLIMQAIPIRGNHDKRSEAHESCFYEVVDYKDMVIMADGVKCRLILSHYFIPFYNGARHMAFMLHGHTPKTEESVMEERIKEDIRRKGLRCEAYNVGAMWQNYEPQTFEEIIVRQERKIPLI